MERRRLPGVQKGSAGRNRPGDAVATDKEESGMNWDQIKGNWQQLKGSAREQWGKLTDDEVEQVAGSRDKLVGLIQEKYGVAKDEAERQADEWQQRQ